MRTQIAVRLPDELVEFLDELENGDATSQAAAVARALERERRRRTAERAAAILALSGTDADLDNLGRHAAVGPANGLDCAGVVGCDNIVTVPGDTLGRPLGFLLADQYPL